MKKVLVIGGGAAGLMSAISASESGASVTVLEAGDQAGKKLLATGNGKCNFTNRRMTADCFRTDEPERIGAILSRFGTAETIGFFRELGIPVRDRNGYLYPLSEQASSVRTALLCRAEELSVRILCGQKVTGLWRKKDSLTVQTADSCYRAEAVILASGGKAAPRTGSDGSGFALAEGLGHRLVPPVPALVQLTASGFPFSKVSGVRVQACIKIHSGSEVLAEDRGEVQLTDYGLSGIPVFQVSRFAARALADQRAVTASLDFFPELSQEAFKQELWLRRARHPLWCSADFLNGMLPDKLAAALLSWAGISRTDFFREIPDQKLEKLLCEAKNLIVTITGTKGYAAAQVTAGGVALDEIREGTCESLLVPGLYLAGEILDVDGLCGGYNLQWAWSTGYLAGRAAAGGMDETGTELGIE